MLKWAQFRLTKTMMDTTVAGNITSDIKQYIRYSLDLVQYPHIINEIIICKHNAVIQKTMGESLVMSARRNSMDTNMLGVSRKLERE